MGASGKPASVSVATTVCALILVIGALALARSVFAPVAFALFVIAVVWPFQSRLQATIPKALAMVISITMATVVISAFGYLAVWAFSRVIRFTINDAERLQNFYVQMTDWLETHGIVLAGLWAEHFDVRWLLRLLPGAMSWVNGAATFLFVVVIYVILGLLEIDDAARKLKSTSGREFERIVLAGSIKTAVKLRRFMLVRTLMSIATGLLVWAFLAMGGIELALEWGVIAFVLNYIPVIGPLVATVFPTLFALAQFASWQTALTVFVCLNLIQFIVGSYLEPRLSGNALSISPFVVLFSVFFWTFLWGVAGAFIGVPIMIAILTLCEQHPTSRRLAELLGSPNDPKSETFGKP